MQMEENVFINRKFKSIVRRIVTWPVALILLILAVLFISCMVIFSNVEQQMTETNLHGLEISGNQLDNFLKQCEVGYSTYIAYEDSYRVLSKSNLDHPPDHLFMHEANTLSWLQKFCEEHEDISGAFAYYRNLNLSMFRGTANEDMHEFIRSEFQREDSAMFNHWTIVKVSGKDYLLDITKYNNLRIGCWLDLQETMKNFGLTGEKYLGPVYLSDESGTAASYDLPSVSEDSGFQNTILDKRELTYKGEVFRNNSFKTETSKLTIGILIPVLTVIASIPLFIKILFSIGFLLLIAAPILTIRMQKKISKPIFMLTDAMREYGQGNLDYRLPLSTAHEFDEFDILAANLNQMVGKLSEMEETLYKTKLREQETELKYISQQIRPHFILNALNVIYTYREDEFPMVKKMVLYLTNYFRYIVNLKVDFVEIEKELRHVENYLQIQKERYLDKFDFFVEWESQASGCLVPPLIIQTFVENSVKYASAPGRLYVYALASIAEGRLKLMIADTGQGFLENKIREIQNFLDTRQEQEGLGIGIMNAIERMDILYGERVEVKVRNALSGGAVIEIYLPVRRNSDV